MLSGCDRLSSFVAVLLPPIEAEPG